MFEDAKRQLRQAQNDIRKEMQIAAAVAIQKTKKDAISMSHGPFKTKQIAKMGHIYATRNPQYGNMPGGTPAIINKQTGDFERHWRTDNPRRSDTGISAKLINDSYVADWMNEGTRKMIRRPIKQFLERRVRYYAEYEMEAAARRLNDKYGR